MADEVIYNDGTIMETKTQLAAILKEWNIID
jgi:dephospho-CoA kinase